VWDLHEFCEDGVIFGLFRLKTLFS